MGLVAVMVGGCDDVEDKRRVGRLQGEGCRVGEAMPAGDPCTLSPLSALFPSQLLVVLDFLLMCNPGTLLGPRLSRSLSHSLAVSRGHQIRLG